MFFNAVQRHSRKMRATYSSDGKDSPGWSHAEVLFRAVSKGAKDTGQGMQNRETSASVNVLFKERKRNRRNGEND